MQCSHMCEVYKSKALGLKASVLGNKCDLYNVSCMMRNYHVRGLSPDGGVLPVYEDVFWTDMGSVYGRLKLLDVATGEALNIALPDTVGVFRWQP